MGAQVIAMKRADLNARIEAMRNEVRVRKSVLDGARQTLARLEAEREALDDDGKAKGDPMEDSEKAIEREDAKGPGYYVIKNSNEMFWGGVGRWTGTHYGACRYPSKEQALASMATIEANTVGGIHLTVEPYSVPEEVAVTAPRSDAGPGAEALEAAIVRAMHAEKRVRELEADVKRWAERVRLLEGRAHAAHAALDGFKDPGSQDHVADLVEAAREYQRYDTIGPREPFGGDKRRKAIFDALHRLGQR